MSIAQTSTIFGVPALSKDAFNVLASQLNLPFLLTGKLNRPDQLEPHHVEFIDGSQKEKFVQDGRFTDLFRQAYLQLVELKRKGSVALSLAEARTVTSLKDVSSLPASEREMIGHLLRVAKKVEDLFMKQQDSFKYIAEIESRKISDPQSYKLFWRNQGPWAVAPKSQSDPFANALPTFNQRRVAIYPQDVELTPAFFEQIQQNKDLANPFTVVVRGADGQLAGVPYHKFYQTEMQQVSEGLAAAARAIENVPREKNLYEYLQAASAAFQNGDWDAADEKWVAMNMGNSRYALRVAPDETYWDPANLKAGFEFWLGLIDENAASFSKRIAPFIQEMEDHLHELLPAYTPRKQNFSLPDFIEMLFISGDHRSDIGAVIGQKLPNFNEQLSRMVVMTNYYTDDLSKALAKEKASLILVEDNAQRYQAEEVVSTTNTLLHEMTHSFGVRGSTYEIRNPDGTVKLDEQQKTTTSHAALGGQNSQIMEELKAQTGGLYWIEWLKARRVISEEMSRDLYTDAILWAFGHISQGFKEADGSPRTYSQLSGIQIRHFLNSGALSLENGKFRIHYDKLPGSIRDLFQIVMAVQVFGDERKAAALRQDITDGEGYVAIRAREIQELYAPYPRISFDLRVAGVQP